MEIQLYQINNVLKKMEEVGHHFQYIKHIPIQNKKASLASFLNYKDDNEVVVELKVNEKIYNVSDFFLETREILLKKIFLTYQYLDKKIDDNIKIHVPTNYIYSLLPEKVEKNIEVLKNDLEHLCYSLNYFLCYYKILPKIYDPINVWAPLDIESSKHYLRYHMGVNVNEKHLIYSWVYLCEDGKNNAPWYLNKDQATKVLARYFSSILDCFNRILKEAEEVI